MSTPTDPIHIGDTAGLIRQTGGTVRMSSDGLVEATVIYKCPSAIYVANLPTPKQPHPDFPSLLLFEFAGVEEEGAIYRLEYIYKGVFGSIDLLLLMQETFTVNTTQEPVETHYSFSQPFENPPVTAAQLAAIQAALDNNVTNIVAMTAWPANQDPNNPPPTWVPITAGSAPWFLWKLKRRGIESYLRPGITAQLRYVKQATSSGSPIHLSTTYLNKVGTTDHVTDAWNAIQSIDPSAAVGNRTWLLSGISWTLMGNAFTITEDHTLSGPTGWIPYLYTPGYTPTAPYYA